MALTILNHQFSPKGEIRGVLFDLDGLVLDTEGLYSRFWREACGHFGFEMSYEQSLAMRAMNAQAGQRVLTGFFGEGADITAIRAERIRRMDAYVAEHPAEVKPGIRELLLELKIRGIPAAITSASPMERIRRYLTQAGIIDLFDALCSGHDVPHGKPEPDIYLHGAASLGLEPGSCLALEDAWSGLLSANRAGCAPVLIPDLDPPNETTRPLVWAVADSASDVIGLLG